MVVAFFATTTQHGAIKGKTQSKLTQFYNLDTIISVGYRVNSRRATNFRIWATGVLKEYMIKGFALDDATLPFCPSIIVSAVLLLLRHFYSNPHELFYARKIYLKKCPTQYNIFIKIKSKI